MAKSKDYYVVDAKRWFDKINGNTYHSVSVFKNGELLDRIPFTYGYGSQYEQSALKILKKHGITEQETMWKFGEEIGKNRIMIFCNDVTRKKDL